MTGPKLAGRGANDGSHGVLLPTFVLGFAFSGLFDGILLHQILQWHHLLSLVQADALRDLRVQILADGSFHILMFAVAAVGLWLLWRRRAAVAAAGAGTRSIAGFVLGFGVWNIVDAVVFHWVLRIHHIRLDPAEAMASDVVWLIVLGLLPTAFGWWLWRRGGASGGPGGGRGGRFDRAAPAALGILVAAASLMAASPGQAAKDPMTAVVFRPGLSGADAVNAVAAVGGRLVWIDATGGVVVIKLDDPAQRWKLYRHGALLVGGTGPAGCINAARI